MAAPIAGTFQGYTVTPEVFTFPYRVLDVRHLVLTMDTGQNVPASSIQVVGAGDTSESVQVAVPGLSLQYPGQTVYIQRIVPPVRRSLENRNYTLAASLNDEFRTLSEIVRDNSLTTLFTPPTVWQANTPYTALVSTVFNSNTLYYCQTTTTGDATFPTAKFVKFGTVLQLAKTASYDVASFTVPEKCPAGVRVLEYIVTEPLYLSNTFALCKAVALTGATLAASFSVKVNNVVIGAINFAPASLTGTFSGGAGLRVLNLGDVLSVDSPAPTDTTLAGVGVTIVTYPFRVLPGVPPQTVMAISQSYLCSGPTQFTFPYPVRFATQLTLALNPGGVVPSSAYTVSGTGVGSTNVTVLYPTVPTNSTSTAPVTLTITQNVSPTQQTVFAADSAVTAQALNQEFNYVYSAVQAGSLGTGFAAPVVWTPNTPYTANYSLVIQANALYLCTTTTAGDETFPTADFTLILNIGTLVTGNLTLDLNVTIPYPIAALDPALVFPLPNAVSVATSGGSAFAGWKATAQTAATASTVLTVKKNGTTFATITFAAASTTGVIAASGSPANPLLFAIGDVLTIIGPATQDATLAGLGITLPLNYQVLP